MIEEAKARVTVREFAAHLKGRGIPDLGKIRCPLPDHEDKTPSCDVVTLAALAWGHERMDEAAGYLLMAFGHEVPQRPPAWYARQKRQAPVRDEIKRQRIEHVRMLVFRLLWMPMLKRLPPWALEEAEDRAWRDSLLTARQLYAQRAKEERDPS